MQELIYNIREVLNLKFRFVNSNRLLFKQLINIINEFISPKDISKEGEFILQDFINKKMITRNPLLYFNYKFSNDVIFHDLYIRDYDGEVYAKGVSFDINEAFAKVLGEFLERKYTKFLHKSRKLIRASQIEILNISKSKGLGYLDIAKLNKPSDNQIKNNKELFYWDENSKFEWTIARDYLNDKDILVPAQVASWGQYAEVKEPYIFNKTSNGCGAAYNKEDAFKSAVLELIQRDAFFQYWNNNLSPDIIDDSSITSEKIKHLLNILKEQGFKIYLLNMTKKAKIPTVCAVIGKVNTGYFVGASTAYTMESALYRAIEESFAAYVWYFENLRSGDYKIEDFVLNKVKGDFTDRRMVPPIRTMLWASKFFTEQVKDKTDFLFNGKLIDYDNKILEDSFDLKAHIKANYESCFVVAEGMVPEYNYNYVKVLILPMYQLYLYEMDAFPIVGGSYPQNTTPHPFP